MNWLIFILEILIVVAAAFVVRYFKEKAKNFANKQDIAEITKQVELIKGEVGAQLYVHQTRYQNEFQILKELSEKVIDLRDTALLLRPTISLEIPGESKEQRNQRLLKAYAEAGVAFYRISEHQKPFYPESVYINRTPSGGETLEI